MSLRRRIELALIALTLCTCPLIGRADRLPVVVDGVFDEWSSVSPAWQDPSGDSAGSGIDFGHLWLADDTRFLYLRFETGAELDLDEGSSVAIYLDTDANAATGLSIGGIGAELEWHLGLRSGTYRYGGGTVTVRQDDLRFRCHPTVSASAFEAAFGRDTLPDGSHSLFLGPTVRVLIRDTAGGGDWLPNTGQTLSYTLDQGTLPPETPVAFAKQQATDMRTLTWNVHNDGLWDPLLQPKFQRTIQAAAPDLLNFQEIYNHTPAQTAALIESWLPSGPGQAWYASDNNDCQIISRYPILQSWAVDGNLASLLDTNSLLGSPLLVISAHLPCCTDDAGRQQEVDRLLSFLRDAKGAGGQITLIPNTPILIFGDMNFVGLAQQLTSLLTGDIVNNAAYGSDFAPDWDGTSLTDVVSRQTEKRMAYTWRNDTSYYWPGRLDFAIYTDHVITLGNHFVLYPPEMSADSLAAHGLLSGDTPSDHLAHCADFFHLFDPADVAVDSCPGCGCLQDQMPPDSEGRVRIDCSLWPNPSTSGATIRLGLGSPARVQLGLYDATGRLVARPAGTAWLDLQPGIWTRTWDGKGMAVGTGMYFLRISGQDASGAFSRSVKWMVVR